MNNGYTMEQNMSLHSVGNQMTGWLMYEYFSSVMETWNVLFACC